jgi:hypothetical protein
MLIRGPRPAQPGGQSLYLVIPYRREPRLLHPRHGFNPTTSKLVSQSGLVKTFAMKAFPKV